MADHIHTYSHSVRSADDVRYQVHAFGEQNDLGSWDGWLVFEPIGGTRPTLRTGRETTQPARDDLEYWAGGLEPIYLDGALGRAEAV